MIDIGHLAYIGLWFPKPLVLAELAEMTELSQELPDIDCVTWVSLPWLLAPVEKETVRLNLK